MTALRLNQISPGTQHQALQHLHFPKSKTRKITTQLTDPKNNLALDHSSPYWALGPLAVRAETPAEEPTNRQERWNTKDCRAEIM